MSSDGWRWMFRALLKEPKDSLTSFFLLIDCSAVGSFDEILYLKYSTMDWCWYQGNFVAFLVYCIELSYKLWGEFRCTSTRHTYTATATQHLLNSAPESTKNWSCKTNLKLWFFKLGPPECHLLRLLSGVSFRNKQIEKNIKTGYSALRSFLPFSVQLAVKLWNLSCNFRLKGESFRLALAQHWPGCDCPLWSILLQLSGVVVPSEMLMC